MKAALRARLTGPDWVDELPWVLLGIRRAPKEDINSSSAELVYGAPLTVLGDFLATPSGRDEPTKILPELRGKVGKLAPVPTARHGSPRTSVPPTLHNSQFVFVRRDCHRIPLQRSYEVPFTVIEHGDKVFKLDVGGRTEVVSVDRLKPAHLDFDQPVSPAVPPRRGRPRTRLSTTPVPSSTTVSNSDICPPTRTMSGRHVRRPARLQ